MSDVGIERAPESAGGAEAVASARRDFLRGEGFALYTDFGRKLVTEVVQTPIQPESVVGDEVVLNMEEAERLGQSSLGLFLMVRAITRRPLLDAHAPIDATFFERFGISEEDDMAGSNHGVFKGGFGDRHFPWHFSAGVANSAAASFEADDRIKPTDMDQITLSDWADMIESDWYSRLMHQLAYTRNSVYQNFGNLSPHYIGDGLTKHLGRRDIRNFETDRALVTRIDESTQGSPRLVAELDPRIREQLRLEMREDKSGSTGCPVARKATRLNSAALSSNPHVSGLVEKGVFYPSFEKGGQVVKLVQRDTAIDAMLGAFGYLLRQYDTEFGTPIFQPAGYDFEDRFRIAQIVHVFRPALGIFYRHSDDSEEKSNND